MRFDDDGATPELRPAALGRIMRVSTWVFLFAATVIVVATDAWAASQGPILALLAAAGLYTFVLHELIPGSVPAAPLLLIEGLLSLLVAAVLIALTGGANSPFFFALPLVVVGAATVVSPHWAVALTGAAAVAYVAAFLAPGVPAGSLYRSKRAGRDRVTGVPVMASETERRAASARGGSNPV